MPEDVSTTKDAVTKIATKSNSNRFTIAGGLCTRIGNKILLSKEQLLLPQGNHTRASIAFPPLSNSPLPKTATG